MAMYNLPKDLLEEILSKVPVKSIKAIRSTCKNWNTLTNEESCTKKLFGKAIATKENEFLVVTMMDYKVYLMRVNLHEIDKDDKYVKSCIKRKAKLISLTDDADYGVDRIFTLYHCDSLLLCITNGRRFVVCNPYCGQTRCIENRNGYHIDDKYALGYEKKKNSPLRNHKILICHDKSFFGIYWCEIYDFNSDSWKVIYFIRDWEFPFFHLGVSIKGNTYWFAREMFIQGQRIDRPDFLICFDFTTERFGPRLHLPFHSRCRDTVTLSSVREEQLAVLFQRANTLIMEIWVTTKIDPKEVSWNKLFLAVNMTPLTGFQFKFRVWSFFIDEKKNVVVVVGKDVLNLTRNIAYIIGKDGYFKEVDLGESTEKYCDPFVCSYVPSSVQIKQAARVMQHHHSVLVGKDGRIICFGYFGFLCFLCVFLSYLCFR